MCVYPALTYIVADARCWNPKRNVRAFDKDFDENRKHTNGDLFENSLQLMLQSNATKKMPRFVKGTLPVQYAACVTEPVSETRRTMGEDLWLRNFANNRERHFLTHVYEDIGREPRDALEEDSSSESDGEGETPASGPHAEEPLEIAYKSDDDSGEDVVPKKKPAKKKREPRILSPKVEPRETKPKIEEHPMSPTAPGRLFPSVLVMKDEIIVVDDEDDDDSDRYIPKKNSKRPRLSSTSRSRQPSTPRKAPPQPSTPRKAPSQQTTSRKAPAEPFPPRKTPSQPPTSKRAPPAIVKPAIEKEKRRSRGDASDDEDGELLPDVSFEPDAKDPPPSRGGTPQHRKLPAKEIAAKTREDHSRRLGLNGKTDGHKQAWLSMLSQADAEGATDVCMLHVFQLRVCLS